MFLFLPSARPIKSSTLALSGDIPCPLVCIDGASNDWWMSVVLGRRVLQRFVQLGGLARTVADFMTSLCVGVLDSLQDYLCYVQVCLLIAMRSVSWKAEILVCDYYTCSTRETPCDLLLSKSGLAGRR